MIQNLLNTAGSTCVIPPGTYDVPERTKLTVPFGVERIIGDGAVVRVVDANGNPSVLTPTMPLFDCGLRPNNSRLEVRGLTVDGPVASSWDPYTSGPHGAFHWVHARTWSSTLILDGVTVNGGYGYGVNRSGGGRLEIHNSSLSGWVGGVAFFESVGTGGGSMLVRNATLAPTTAHKYDSIGGYIHPHLDVTWDNVSASSWKRWACYLNGSPQSAGNHTLIDVTATDCSLIQSGSSSETVLVRCVEQGTPQNGGSFFKGPVRSTGSRWASTTGMIGFMSGNAPDRRFIGDTIATGRTWLAGGSNTAGRVLLNDCTVELTSKTQVVKLTNQSQVAVRVVSTGYTGTSTVFTFNAEGGSLRFIDCPVFPNVRAVAPGVLLP